VFRVGQWAFWPEPSRRYVRRSFDHGGRSWRGGRMKFFMAGKPGILPPPISLERVPTRSENSQFLMWQKTRSNGNPAIRTALVPTNTPACHARGRGFEPRRSRHGIKDLAKRPRTESPTSGRQVGLLSAFCSRADDNLGERITRSVRRIRRAGPRSPRLIGSYSATIWMRTARQSG
jgi:hypothetical protein